MSVPAKKRRIKNPIIYGGKGSGNFGHEGRPGAVGGSGGGGSTGDLPLARGANWKDLEKESYRNELRDRAAKGEDIVIVPNLDKIHELANSLQNKLEDPTTAYFGLSGSKFQNMKEGDTFSALGMRSTTDSIERAQKYASDGAVFKVDLPRGTAAVNNIVLGVRELTLFPGAKFQVIAEGTIKQLKLLDDGVSYVNNLYRFQQELDSSSKSGKTPTTQSSISILKQVQSINIYAQIARVDPTRTLVLRNNFAAQMTARFRKLKAIIQKAVVDDDCFGLAKPESQGRRIVVQGGPGSGNFGHAGRPGAVGGSGGGGGWESVTSRSDAAERFSQEFGIKLSVDRDFQLQLVDEVGKEFYRMKEMFPDIPVNEVIKEVNLTTGPLGRSGKANGTFDSDGSKMELRPAAFGKEEITLGQFSSTNDRLSALMRHEYGHGVHEYLWNKSEQSRKDWMNVREGVGSGSDYQIAKAISHYGATVPQETFAESFRAWTSPVYKSGALPRVVESYFDKHLVRKSPTTQATYADLTTRGGRSFDFPTSQEKSAVFLQWLQTQEQAGILETVRIPQIGTGIDSAWTDTFIKDSYQRGVQRARDELLRGKYAVPSMEVTGGISASMMQPMHIDRLGQCFSRSYEGLKGITSAMDMQISHVLTKGLADGDSQATIAKKLLATIDGNNAGTLGITDSLGRFIPAERRAAMLARTEVIRAHAQGTLQEFKNWGVAGVNVLAEWVTAGFNVCPECDRLAAEGPYTIEQAWDMLPAHPNCRCAWLAKPIGDKGEAVEVVPEEIGNIESAINPVSAESLPSWGRVPTQDELSEVVSMADTLPDEYKSWIKNPQQVSLGIIDTEDRLAKISGGELWLRASDLKSESTMQHELRHLFVNPEVIKASGGAEKMWQEVMAADFRKPVHVNLMLSRTGERAAIDEFLAVMGDTYKSGMAKQEQVDLLIGGPKFRMTVEAERNSGQSGYFNAKVWTKPEADEAVSMWRNWMKISAPETPAAGVVEWKSRATLQESNSAIREMTGLEVEGRKVGQHPRTILQKEFVDEFGKEVSRLKTFGIDLTDQVTKIEFGDNPVMFGAWDSYRKILELSMDNPILGIQELTLGANKSTTVGFQSTARHEIGHVVRDYLSEDQLTQWKDLYKSSLPKSIQKTGPYGWSWEDPAKEWWAKKVSIYGSTNEHELFAESFTAYTSPAYKRGLLPKEMEQFFDKLLKKKSLTTQSKPQVNYHVITTHGGQGSGNFGHAGRPGEQGGSGGRGGTESNQWNLESAGGDSVYLYHGTRKPGLVRENGLTPSQAGVIRKQNTPLVYFARTHAGAIAAVKYEEELRLRELGIKPGKGDLFVVRVVVPKSDIEVRPNGDVTSKRQIHPNEIVSILPGK